MAKAKRSTPSKSELPGVEEVAEEVGTEAVATVEPPEEPQQEVTRAEPELLEFFTLSASLPYTQPEDPNYSNYAGRERRVDTRKLSKDQWDLLQGIRAACVCKNVRLKNDAPIVTCGDVFKHMLEQLQDSLQE